MDIKFLENTIPEIVEEERCDYDGEIMHSTFLPWFNNSLVGGN
jgi:hypothetical protein